MLKKQKKQISISKSVLAKSRIVIVRSQYNEQITKSLEDNCLKVLSRSGVKKTNVKVIRVPGALEIPVIAQKIAKAKKADVIITLGAIIKGDTYHFELVANECARGCMDVSVRYGVPVIFEVLAADNVKQAKERALNNENNKGREAALTALKMLEVMFKRL